MKRIIETFSRFDKKLILYVTLLSIIGMIFSLSSNIRIGQEEINYTPFVKQIIFFVIGIMFLFLLNFLSYKKISEHAFFIYLFAVGLLIYVLFFGKVVNNSKRWIYFIFFSLQPSEFVKVFMIIVIAAWFNRFKNQKNEIFYTFLLLGVVAVPVFFIFLEPDLGTALIFIPITVSMMFVSGINIKFLISISGIFILSIAVPVLISFSHVQTQNVSFFLSIFSHYNWLIFLSFFFLFSSMILILVNLSYRNRHIWNLVLLSTTLFIGISLGLVADLFVLKNYQKERILTFVNPAGDKENTGYNVYHSKITIGSGAIKGKGIGEGTHGQLGFLPSRSTDFIFSVIGEETGFIGSTVVLVLYFLFLNHLIKIGLNVKDYLGGLMITGITTMFLVQIFVNLGMTLGVVPVTGLPLPFITAGGSSMLASMIAVGLVSNIEYNKYVHN